MAPSNGKRFDNKGNERTEFQWSLKLKHIAIFYSNGVSCTTHTAWIKKSVIGTTIKDDRIGGVL